MDGQSGEQYIVTPEILTALTELGKLRYPIGKCISLIEVKESDRDFFSKSFLTEGSQIFMAYRNGIDIADFELDQKLYQLAKVGDVKAMDKLEKRISKHLNELKEEVRTGRYGICNNQELIKILKTK